MSGPKASPTDTLRDTIERSAARGRALYPHARRDTYDAEEASALAALAAVEQLVDAAVEVVVNDSMSGRHALRQALALFLEAGKDNHT